MKVNSVLKKVDKIDLLEILYIIVLSISLNLIIGYCVYTGINLIKLGNIISLDFFQVAFIATFCYAMHKSFVSKSIKDFTFNKKDKTVEIGAIYKLKEGRFFSEKEELLSKNVKVLGFALNPLKNDDCYVEFAYVYKDTYEPTNNINPVRTLKYNKFLDFFDLDLSCKEMTT